VAKVRPPRSVWFGTGVVVVFFAAVTVAIGCMGGGGPDIPHPVAGDRAACGDCHTADRLPDDHKGRVEESCRSCHSEKPGEADSAREDRPGDRPPEGACVERQDGVNAEERVTGALVANRPVWRE
jgi:hypothetical protein